MKGSRGVQGTAAALFYQANVLPATCLESDTLVGIGTVYRVAATPTMRFVSDAVSGPASVKWQDRMITE